MARAALDLFNRQGYDETTVDEIAAAVGVSRRTFFRYYDSKREVVWGEFDAELVRLEQKLASASTDEPVHREPRKHTDDGRAASGGHGHQPVRCGGA